MTAPSRPLRRGKAALLGWLALALVLGGCSFAPPLPPSPAFDDAPVTGTLKRRLTFTPDDETQPSRTLIGLIRLDGSRLRAVLLTPYGQRLVTLVHGADGSRFEPGDVPREALREALPVSPEWLASRLEWSLWPIEALRDAFAGSPWTVAVAGDVREIRHRGELIARITPAAANAARTETVLLDDRQGDYRLRISPIEDADP